MFYKCLVNTKKIVVFSNNAVVRIILSLPRLGTDMLQNHTYRSIGCLELHAAFLEIISKSSRMSNSLQNQDTNLPKRPSDVLK